jgi:serine/threonine protein kinase
VPTLVPTPSSTNNPQNDSNGTTNNSEIANTSTWVDVFIGSNSQFAFATLSDGTSWSWGSGIEGQLATLEINVAFSPQRMLTVQSWAYIAGGTAQVLGVSTAGGGYAWGTGPLGQLGAGLAINATVGPIKISTPDQLDEQTGIWSDMCANEEQSCGIYNGALYCWGSAATELLGSPGGDTSFPRQVQGKGTWGVTPFSPPPAPLPPPLSPPPQPSPPHKNPKPPPPPPVKPPKSTGASVGEIIGAAVGGVVFASLILLGLLLWRRKVDQKRKALKNSIIDNGDEKPDAVLLWAAHSQEIESPRAALTRLIPPTLSPLEFDWSEVQVLKPLGAGSFGAVYLANIHHTKMAVKVLVDADAVVAAAAASTQPLSQKSGIDESNSSTAATDLNDISSISSTFVVSTTPSVPKAPIEKMLQEASLMATLQHPNVVHLLGFCISPPCMAVEYCPRGSLDDVLAQGLADSESAKRLTWIRRLRMAKDIAAGLLHLHSRVPPILHRDVKSPNMLVTADYTVKVADMGLSKLAEEVQGGMRNRSTMGGGGNPRWLAPEILNGKNASKESDVFSFAMVQLELLTWQLPWNEENFWSVSSAVQRGERPTIPSFGQLPGFDKAMTSAQKESVSKYIELMTRCWAQDPVQRPDMSVVADELEKLCREHGAKSKN